MEEIKPFDFDAAMLTGALAAATEAGTPPNVQDISASALTTVRAFRPQGIDQAVALLKKMRSENDVCKTEQEELLEDPQATEIVPGSFKIDRERTFTTKLELCEYLTSVFGDEFIENNRSNSGLWTWLAFAFSGQFLKSRRDILEVASNPRWIYDRGNYRYSIRHFIAGALYLYHDFHAIGEDVKDMLFSSSPREFGRLVDAMTYKMEGTRSPVAVKMIAKLYYDPSVSRKFKSGAVSQDKPGTIRELLRVISQIGMTRDFYSADDADELWRILPGQFDGFKNGR